jgi:predicted NBD/HSP70 family sugar kinase
MYIGIDLHKETCYATTLDKEGEIIDRREFKNEREEWEKFVEDNKERDRRDRAFPGLQETM